MRLPIVNHEPHPDASQESSLAVARPTILATVVSTMPSMCPGPYSLLPDSVASRRPVRTTTQHAAGPSSPRAPRAFNLLLAADDIAPVINRAVRNCLGGD